MREKTFTEATAGVQKFARSILRFKDTLVSAVINSGWFKVPGEFITWHNRPLEEIHPIMYLDATAIKARDRHHVKNEEQGCLHRHRRGSWGR